MLITFEIKKIGKDNIQLRKVSRPVVDLKKKKRFEGIEKKQKEGLIKK